jgi:hypothetical protein
MSNFINYIALLNAEEFDSLILTSMYLKKPLRNKLQKIKNIKFINNFYLKELFALKSEFNMD